VADRSIVVKIGADVTGLVNGLKTAAKATQDAANRTDEWVGKNQQNIDHLSGGFLKAGAVLTGFAALSVARFAEFDKAMSSAGAATMESAENMGLLRQAAIEAGADTQYSATEAASGIEELAKAGVSTADILRGGLAGSLDLAASGAIGVGEAAEIAATAMTQFGLGGDQVSHIADLLAAGAGKAQGGVGDLGMALKQAGLVADQTGLSIEETTAGLTAFASAGLVGSDAGTSFKSMLQRLTPQSQEAQRAMDELGISAYDSQGQFIGLAEFAGNLQNALRDLTPEQRNAAMATIFGSDAVRAANVLYEQGEPGIRKWTDAVDEQGYAAEQARIRTDNLVGDVERLGGSLDTALIQSGSGANAVLREMAQGAESAVDAIGGMPEPILSATTLLVGAGGLTTLGIGGLGKLVTSVHETKAAVQGLGISMKAAGALAGGLAAVITVGTLAFANWAKNAAEARARADEYLDTLDGAGNQTEATVRKINSALSKMEFGQSFGERLFGENPVALIDFANELGIATDDLTGYVLGERDAIERVTAARREYLDTFGAPEKAKAEDLIGLLDREAAGLSAAEKEAVRKARADEAAGVASDGAASAVERYADAQRAGTQATEQYTDALKELVEAQQEAAGVVLSLRDAERQFEQSVADADAALKENGATLDITTEKGRANQAALDDVASAGWDVIASMRENGSTQEDLQAQMQTTRDRFLSVAGQMGMTSDEAHRLADELGLIPADVSVEVAVKGLSDVLSRLGVLDQTLNSIDGKTVTASVAIKQYGQAAMATGGPVGDPFGVLGYATGGATRGFPGGGGVHGPGTGTSDSIPAWLSNGEWVIKASSVAKYGHAFMAALNAGTLPRYATGGPIGARYATGGQVAPTVNVAAPAITPGVFDGMVLTLMVDGQPIRAIARTEATSVVRTARSWGGAR